MDLNEQVKKFHKKYYSNIGRAIRSVEPKGGRERLIIAYADDKKKSDERYICSLYFGFPDGWKFVELKRVVDKVSKKIQLESDSQFSVNILEYQGDLVRRCIVDFLGKGEDNRCRWCIEFRQELERLAALKCQGIEEWGNCIAKIHEGEQFHWSR